MGVVKLNKPILFKLARQNIKKNSRYTFPYILTCIGTIMMTYNVSAIRDNIEGMWGAQYIQSYMVIGLMVIAIFSVVFLLYTNRFVINQRQKELGLYTVLGMEKSHVCMMVILESCLMFLLSLIIGLFLGILFNKAMLMLLFKLMHVSQAARFSISIQSIISTTVIFGIILCITIFSNVINVIRKNPIDLIHAQNEGEKEPKSNILITLIGLISLISGYYMAVTVKDVINAVLLFFVAVFLVIIGTYCLFTSGSIAFLKLLKKNKHYYYKSKHFVSLSGLIYRMKQNAVGLGNICILSTMVLVILNSTLTIYLGVDRNIRNRYPNDYGYYFRSYSENERDAFYSTIENEIEKNGGAESLVSYLFYDYRMESDEIPALNQLFNEQYLGITVLPLSSFNKMTNQSISLSENEILLYEKYRSVNLQELTLRGKTFQVKDVRYTPFVVGRDYADINSTYYVVIDDSQLDSLNINKDTDLSYYIGFDCKENLSTIVSSLQHTLLNLDESFEAKEGRNSWYYGEDREDNREDVMALYGGFLFLGIFLGSLFLMATVLIIYYKQITEGFQDKKRFEILQKVGMDRKEIKQTINDQVLMVFFLPLLTAIIHTCFAYPMVKKILSAIALGSVQQYFLCALIITFCFIVIYACIYKLTAHAYIKIVEEKI